MYTEKFDFYSPVNLKSYNLDQTMRYQLNVLGNLDFFTRRHSENVANLVCRICEYLHTGKAFTIYCTICGYLHDIGKLFIPAEILQKPSQLTPEEFEIMKKHTTLGYDMCMKDLKLRPYAAGPYYHHEALNGSGYPQGLVAKDIPYEAQIIRVADEYDAITSKRQYKTHIGTVDTLKILIENATPVKPKDGMRGVIKDSSVGKIDKKILKALFKVIIDDTEYEISARIEYLDFVKEEIARLNNAEKYYKKYLATPFKSKKEYYQQGVEMYLRKMNGETIDNFESVLNQYKESYIDRKKHIDQLYQEIKEIKKLRV